MRIFIYPSDIKELTGKSIQSARRIYNHLKDALKLQEQDLLTIKQYCEYYGLEEKFITEIVNKSPVVHSHKNYKAPKNEN